MNPALSCASMRLRLRVVDVDVLAEHRGHRLPLPRQHRAGDRDADAAADVPHQVEEARRVTHPLRRDGLPSPPSSAARTVSAMPVPCSNCGQKMSQ